MADITDDMIEAAENYLSDAHTAELNNATHRACVLGRTAWALATLPDKGRLEAFVRKMDHVEAQLAVTYLALELAKKRRSRLQRLSAGLSTAIARRMR